MCYSWFFGALAAIVTGIAYVLLYQNFPWHPYLLWLIAINAVTFVMYGVDSVLGKHGKADPPETVLHLMSAGGGFVGTWVARPIFGYKVDWKGNPWMQILLIVSTLGHAVLAYSWLINPPD
jgi:uncharacterized membrane protein YsdA (DUF1294 family)